MYLDQALYIILLAVAYALINTLILKVFCFHLRLSESKDNVSI